MSVLENGENGQASKCFNKCEYHANN